jgi:hypothetical protein
MSVITELRPGIAREVQAAMDSARRVRAESRRQGIADVISGLVESEDAPGWLMYELGFISGRLADLLSKTPSDENAEAIDGACWTAECLVRGVRFWLEGRR